MMLLLAIWIVCAGVVIVKSRDYFKAYCWHKRACAAAAAFHDRDQPAPPSVMAETWKAFDATWQPFGWIAGSCFIAIMAGALFQMVTR